MYHVYVKNTKSFTGRDVLGEYDDVDDAFDRAEEEVKKNPDTKYIIEKTSGAVNGYGELEVTVIAEN